MSPFSWPERFVQSHSIFFLLVDLQYICATKEGCVCWPTVELSFQLAAGPVPVYDVEFFAYALHFYTTLLSLIHNFKL